MTETKRIACGDLVVDTITGFAGTVTARTEYLYGCVRCAVEGGDKDGKPEEFYFDEQRLELVEGTKEPTATTGGPRPTPPRAGLRGAG